MRIYWRNEIDSATLTPSSSALNQNVEYLKIPQLAKSFDFGQPNPTLTIQLNGAQSISSFIIDAGNIDSGSTLILEANTTNDFTTPLFTTNLTRASTIYYADFDSQAYEWWRLSFSGNVGNVRFGYITIGGAYTQMPGIDPEVTLEYNTTSSSSYSISGQVFGNKAYRFLSTDFEFPVIREQSYPGPGGVMVASRGEILQMWETVENNTPVWIMLWENSLTEYAPVFCVFDQDSLEFEKQERGRYYSTELSLRQVF